MSYQVKKITNETPDLVNAFKKNDFATIDKFISTGKLDFDIFICINQQNHAFVLCDGKGVNKEGLEDDPLDDPFKIPMYAFCWTLELELENAELRQYQISKAFKIYRDVHSSVKRHFYVGRFKNTSANALELAALHTLVIYYRGELLRDGIEFARAFCEELAAYCDNSLEMKEGLQHSIEILLRQSRSYSVREGISSLFSSCNKNVLLIGLITFIFFWPIFVGYIFVTYYL